MNLPRRPGLPEAVALPAALVERRLVGLFDAEEARWGAVDRDLADLVGALRSAVLGGGKRLRPVFCYWAFVGAGGNPEDPAMLDAGAALEMLHAAALIHDDLIDRSTRRHGAVTAHVASAARHRGEGWRGDSERFGAAVAILLGDLALAYCDQLLDGAPHAAAHVFSEARVEVNVGQYLDVLSTASGPAPSAEDAAARARQIARFKTAKYTVERPLHLGAALASPAASSELVGPLSAFGLPLGEAFQLHDDLLGVFGDPETTGKPVGDDLREGKPTLLVALALAAIGGADTRLFAERLGAPDLSDSEVAEMQRLIESSGARAGVERSIAALTSAAFAALEWLPILPEARGALGEVARFVAGRDH